MQAGQLLAGQAGAENRLAHLGLRHRLFFYLVLQAHVAQDLDCALVGDMSAGRVGRPAIFGQHNILNAVSAEKERGRAADWPVPDDQDICFKRSAHR